MNIKALKIKSIDAYSIILSGFLYIALGLVFITQKNIIIFAVRNLRNFLVVLFALTALLQIFGLPSIFKLRFLSLSRLFSFIVNFAMALILFYKPLVVVAIFPILYGLYAFVGGFIKFLVYLQNKKNKIPRRGFILLEALILSVMGTMIIMHPLSAISPVSNLFGMFFMIYGLSFIIEGFLEVVPSDKKTSFKRKIRISLPIFLLAFIPHRILLKINKVLETNELNEEDLIVQKEASPFDLEVLIHVGEKGVSAFGHVDIFFNGKVMTYGSYDEATYKLKGLISDGVLMVISDKEKYIKFSQDHLDKTVFGFGLKLSVKQKDRIKEKIDEIYGQLYEWQPKSQRDEAESIKRETPYTDYASIVYKHLGADFYKFSKGPFKTYFVMNTNCVLLADRIVGQSGIDLVNVNGLISPGAYFDFFNREFLRENSFVISRTIYHKSKDKHGKIGQI